MAKTKKEIPYTQEQVARADYSEISRMFFGNRTLSKLETLPVPTDDLTKELGIDIYDTMMNDPQISSAIHAAAYQVLSHGVQVLPSHPGASDPKNKKSVEIADFIKRVIENVGRGEGVFSDHMKQGYMDSMEDSLLRSFQYGNSVSEMTLTVPKTGKLSNFATLKHLSTRSPDTYQYIVDKYKNVPYLLVWTGKTAPTEQGKDAEVKQIYPSGWKPVPASKFFIRTHRPYCGDPRGVSALRPAYHSWYMLQNIWPEYHKYLVQFASGILKGTTAPNAIAKPDPENPGKMIRPLDIMSAQLRKLHNGSYIALEDGNEVEIMWPNGDGTPFKIAVELLGNQIIKSILLSTLSTSTANNQTRAASTVHKDVSDLLSLSVKKSFCNAQREQIWRPLVALNFGIEAAEELTPIPSLGRITPEDRASMISSWAAGGYKLAASQMEFIASELEIPLPTQEEIKIMFETMKNESTRKVTPGASDAKQKEIKKQKQQTERDKENG